MTSAIDVTKPVYGNPTTQSVRDNFTAAYDEITDLQTEIANRVAKDGDTMTGFLYLNADPTLAMHAANRAWVINQIRSSANAVIYIGDYDAAADIILTSGSPQFIVGQPLPAATASNGQTYFTAKTGSATGIGHQPPGGVPVGSWLLSNGVNWNVYQPSASGVIAQTVPVNPQIAGLPGGDVYAALGSVPTLYLPKSGGILTGLLTLSGAPTANLHATTKAYVDNAIPVFNANPVYQSVSIDNPGTVINQFNFDRAGKHRWQVISNSDTNGDNFSIRRYDDAGVMIDTPFLLNRANGALSLTSNLSLTVPTNAYAFIGGRSSDPTISSNDLLLIQSRSDTTHSNPAGISIQGPTHPSPNSIQMRYGGGTNSATFMSDGTFQLQNSIKFTPAPSGLYWDTWNAKVTFEGNIVLQNGATSRFYIGPNNDFHWDNGGAAVNMSLDGNGLQVTNSVNCAAVLSDIWYLRSDNSMYITKGSSTTRLFAWSSTYQNIFDTGTGNWIWQIWDTTWPFMFRLSDKSIIAFNGPVYGTSFIPLCDEELKENIQPSNHGLQEIIGIRPITYTRKKGANPSRKPPIKLDKPNLSPEEEMKQQQNQIIPMEYPLEQEIGFSAQQVQLVYPEAVIKFEPDEPNSILAVGILPILAALVNAVKELNRDVQAMKRRNP